MLRKKKNKKVTRSAPYALSVCCEATIGVFKVGEEVFVRCTKCGEYIGHVTGRRVGILESKYESFIAQACRDRRITHLPGEGELTEMYPIYCDYLQKFAKQAARQTVGDYIAIENA